MKAVIELNALRPVLPEFSNYGISILESRHAPGFSMALSEYDFSEVILVLDGEGWIIHEGVMMAIGRKDVVVIPKGTLYRLEDCRCLPLSMICLCLKPSPEVATLFEPILPERFSVVRRSSLSLDVAACLRTILHEQSLPGVHGEQVVLAQALMLFARLRRGATEGDVSASPHELVARVRDYVASLEGSYYQQETLDMVASRLKISPKTLTRHFRAIAGKSRRRYIEALRLKQACRLLLESDQSVTSIAFGCGFEDLSTFFRAFRSVHGLSPGDWREHRRG